MKYNNRKTEARGVIFDSMMESEYYVHLLQEQDAGRVTDIQLQPVFLLQPAFRKFGKTIRKMEYKADFLVTYADGTRLVIDVKGALTDVFKLKSKLFDYYHPDLPLLLITKHQDQWIEVKNKPKTKNGRTQKTGGVRRGKKRRNVQV